MDLKMFDFKNFLKNDFIYEANIGESPETAVLIDNEDLDFLYQLDYQYWKHALHTRYEVLLDSLRARDNVRKSIESYFIKYFNHLYPATEDRQNISLESFIEFVNNFASRFNDYGQKKDTPITEKVKFRNWEKDFRKEYSYSFDDAKTRNSRDFLKNIRYMVLDYIVPLAPEKSFYPIKFNENYIKDQNGNIVKAKFYINRLIQKLETNQGHSISLPKSSLVLHNLSKVLAKKDPIEMEDVGKYGFDMSKARVEEIGGVATGKTRGFTFPQLRAGSSGLTKVFNNLMRLNYQRHMGPLPSDENFESYADMRDESGSPALIYKKLDSKSRNIEDNLNLVNLKTSLKNKIKNFIARHRTEINWINLKENGLYSIIDKKFADEIEQGTWAGTSDKIINHIIKNLPHGYKVGPNKKEFVVRYVTNYQKVSGNSPILEKFSEYFAAKQAEHIISSRQGSVATPRILDGDTYEQRKANFERLDDKLRKQIESNLSPAEIDYFIKTGRLSLSLKGKKLIPGRFTHPPIILPFLKTTSPDGQPISVPLIRPGKYLSGFEGIKDDETEVEYEDEETDKFDDKEEIETEKDYKGFGTPSTSDRTSVYIGKDENGEEKEVKIIDAASSDRYTSKTGSRGAYYTTRKNERGYGERKFSFSKWKRSDREAFLKVFAHPDYEQIFPSQDVANKYEQLFGKDLYDEVFASLDDPYSFYEGQDLIDGFPFKLQGFRIGQDNERVRKFDDSEKEYGVGGELGVNTSYTAISKLTIKPDRDGDIIGFPYVIKSILKCLTLKSKVCNNDGYLGMRMYYFEDPDRVQDLHDRVVFEAVRTNVWKKFTSKTSAMNSFCSTIGKLFQSSGLGQASRKKRLELIGSASNQYFKMLLSDYKSHLDNLASKENKGTTNRKKINILSLIDKIDPLNDNNDDDIVEWFFPGYKEKSQSEKGSFISDTKNFSPVFEDWKRGQPPTDLKDFLSLVYENFSDGIPEDLKAKLIDKVNKERDYLVGEGSVEQGVIGTKSYIWSSNLLKSSLEREQIESFHKYISSIYDADLKRINDLPNANISSDYEEEEPEPSSDTTKQSADKENDEYLSKFSSYFTKLSPMLIDVLSLSSRIPFLRSNLTENARKSNKIAEIIGALDTVLNLNKKNSVVNLINLIVTNMEAPAPQIYKLTVYEKDFIKENKDAKSVTFLRLLYNICLSLYKLADALDQSVSYLEKDVLDSDNRNKISSFLKQNFGEKEPSKLFLVSNIYRNNPKALEHYGITYNNIHSLIESLFQKVSDMNRPSVLRRIDLSRLSSGEDVDIAKLSSWELIKLINSKNTDQEKIELAKKIKDFYIAKNKWDFVEPFFKRYIDGKIN